MAASKSASTKKSASASKTAQASTGGDGAPKKKDIAKAPSSNARADRAISDTKGRAAASWGDSVAKARGKRPSDKLPKQELIAIYRTMVMARRFEELVIDLFRAGELPGFVHVAIGQEGIAAGTGHSLGDGDFIGSTHRAHAHIIARGASPEAMFAEMLGRDTGLCRGKGGSMHLADMSHNVVGANGVVGSGAPMMTGVAMAQKELKTGNIAVAFYGDGASSQGNVHEAMNLAKLWDLPVIFILEDNKYAESTPAWQTTPVDDLAVRGAAFQMKTLAIDGNDVLEVYDAVQEAAEHARSGKGPVYIVAETKRLSGHYVGDAEVYRPKGEAKAARATDPIPAFRAVLVERKVRENEIKAVEAEVEATLEVAVAAARAADRPAPEDALKHVYAEYPYNGPVIGI
ncbi:MAG: thiamine pyrophosphate-dependent dehydrogenase E1 component subunit alpha [Thermoleophilia bacterium]|nr:thiamine pyrophosphate-dependent dehydrogenase E1 component subunit alpha [Thermoleophilia bacterium]